MPWCRPFAPWTQTSSSAGRCAPRLLHLRSCAEVGASISGAHPLAPSVRPLQVFKTASRSQPGPHAPAEQPDMQLFLRYASAPADACWLLLPEEDPADSPTGRWAADWAVARRCSKAPWATSLTGLPSLSPPGPCASSCPARPRCAPGPALAPLSCSRAAAAASNSQPSPCPQEECTAHALPCTRATQSCTLCRLPAPRTGSLTSMASCTPQVRTPIRRTFCDTAPMLSVNPISCST